MNLIDKRHCNRLLRLPLLVLVLASAAACGRPAQQNMPNSEPAQPVAPARNGAPGAPQANNDYGTGQPPASENPDDAGQPRPETRDEH